MVSESALLGQESKNLGHSLGKSQDLQHGAVQAWACRECQCDRMVRCSGSRNSAVLPEVGAEAGSRSPGGQAMKLLVPAPVRQLKGAIAGRGSTHRGQ